MRKYSEKKIQADKTGEGYIFQMFYNELQKHKRPIGMVETDEVLKAFGYDLEDLQNNKALQAGLQMAVNAVNDEVYEDNRPQPVDRYHFTDKDGGSGSSGKPVRCITDGEIYNNVKETAEHYNISAEYVRMACNGAVKSAKGLQFEYIEKE